MRFLLGFGLGLLTPLIFRAWLKTPSSQMVQKLRGVDGRMSGDGPGPEFSPPTSPDRTDNMSSEDRRTEFEWPKVQGSSRDSEFHW